MTLEWISFENDRREQIVLALGSEFVYNRAMQPLASTTSHHAELATRKPADPLHLREPWHPLNPTNPNGLYQRTQREAAAHPTGDSKLSGDTVAAAAIVGSLLIFFIVQLFRKS